MAEAEVVVGDKVAWKWAGGVAEGVAEEVLRDRVEIVSKGSHIARNGSKDNPAIIIRHDSGSQVLKLQSELLDVAE